MLNKIIIYSNVTGVILLFGNTDLPVQINEEIFKAVHAYIRKTVRKSQRNDIHNTFKQSNQLSLPQRDDCKTREDTK